MTVLKNGHSLTWGMKRTEPQPWGLEKKTNLQVRLKGGGNKTRGKMGECGFAEAERRKLFKREGAIGSNAAGR